MQPKGDDLFGAVASASRAREALASEHAQLADCVRRGVVIVRGWWGRLGKKPSKTIVQPDQYELFARVRARFADIGALGTVSLLLTISCVICAITACITTSEDFWLRSALMESAASLLTLAFIAVMAEVVRSMRWVESKATFATIHVLAILGTFAVLAFLLWQTKLNQDTRAIERASEAAKSKAATEAIQAAKEACEKRRADEVEKSTKRRADMRTLHQRCREEFERTKTIWTQDTVDQRCRSRQISVEAAEREFKAANSLDCSSAGKRPTQ